MLYTIYVGGLNLWLPCTIAQAHELAELRPLKMNVWILAWSDLFVFRRTFDWCSKANFLGQLDGLRLWPAVFGRVSSVRDNQQGSFLQYCLPFRESTTERRAGYDFWMSLALNALSSARRLMQTQTWMSSIQSISSTMSANKSGSRAGLGSVTAK